MFSKAGAMFFAGILAMTANVSFSQAATITGKVNFKGQAPAATPINFGAEKQCADLHGGKPVLPEDFVVNPNGTLQWALVHIKEGAQPGTEVPAQPAEIDQNGCMFVPHVIAVRVGQKVNIKNGDPVLHNVRNEAKNMKIFNLAQPIQGMTTARVFDKPEIGMKLRCDVHFWMTGYVHVLDHPYYALTGEDGSFKIENLPAGTYTLEAWHEKLGTQTQTVTVTAEEEKATDFTFEKV